MMSNCKDCRSWNKDKFLCSAIGGVDITPWGTWSPGGADFSVAVVVSDDSGLEAGLKTGPFFGCVQFQRRETQETQ